jgi:hypothetical protein
MTAPITKRIKLPQRSNAPGELRYKLFRCGLLGTRALGAASSALDCVRVNFPGVVRRFGRPRSDRVGIADPVRRETRLTASRRQLSSRSSEIGIDFKLEKSMRSTPSSIAVWGATKSAPGQQPGERGTHTRLKKQSSVAGVGAHVAGAAASTRVRATAAAASTDVRAAASAAAASTGIRGAASAAAASTCRAATSTCRAAASAARAASSVGAASARRAARAAVIAAVVAAGVRSGESQRAD